MQTAADYAAEVAWNAQYVLGERAALANVRGNDGGVAHRDTGHDGFTLDDFCAHSAAKQASLTRAEVAALRLYTSSTFRLINGAQRIYCLVVSSSR